MNIILLILTFIIGILYINEIIKSMKREKEYKILDEKYAKALGENMDTIMQLETLKQEYKKQKEMSDEIKELQKRSRALKHDMKNHIMVIASYLTAHEYEEAKDYISKILDNLNKMYTYISTGNSLLNYIVNTKLQFAKDKGIDVKAEIENLSFEQIGSVDFSALLSNLLDNSIEGCLNSMKKELNIKILRKRGYDTILVKNRIDTSVLKGNPQLISTKENNEEHGNGLKQIKSIVEKYEGMMDIYEEDNFFCTYVVWPY